MNARSPPPWGATAGRERGRSERFDALISTRVFERNAKNADANSGRSTRPGFAEPATPAQVNEDLARCAPA